MLFFNIPDLLVEYFQFVDQHHVRSVFFSVWRDVVERQDDDLVFCVCYLLEEKLYVRGFEFHVKGVDDPLLLDVEDR